MWTFEKIPHPAMSTWFMNGPYCALNKVTGGEVNALWMGGLTKVFSYITLDPHIFNLFVLDPLRGLMSKI